jgi:hypothetical protein
MPGLNGTGFIIQHSSQSLFCKLYLCSAINVICHYTTMTYGILGCTNQQNPCKHSANRP